MLPYVPSSCLGSLRDPGHACTASRNPGYAAQVETVDSLMAQITPAPAPAPRPQRQLNIPSLDSVPASTAVASTQIPPVTPMVRANPMANRSSLFDLPDPSAKPVDPFSSIPAPVDMDQPVAAKRRLPLLIRLMWCRLSRSSNSRPSMRRLLCPPLLPRSVVACLDAKRRKRPA